MPVESLTYAALAERLGCSPEAARALAKRLRLPRQKANDGKALVVVDLAEIDHKPLPARSPAGHLSVAETMQRNRLPRIKIGSRVGRSVDCTKAFASKVHRRSGAWSWKRSETHLRRM